MKQKFINFFMDIAERIAELSYAKRLQVGCVIVRDRNILSFGYNGTPEGWDNNCEDTIYFETGHDSRDFPFYDSTKDRLYKLVTKSEVIHAEMNALLKISASTQSSVGSTMFLTHSPCMNCAKLIVNAKISEVIYRDTYANDGIQFLLDCGVKVTKWEKLEHGSHVEVVK